MIRKVYYYFFYKIYKSIEYTSREFGGEFLTHFKAGVIMGVLEIWLLLSLGAYYAIITKRAIELTISMPIVYIPFIVIIVFNYYTLDYLDIWKYYFKEFDKLPKDKNRIGSWVVFGIAVFIVLNLIFSFYLMSQIDWSQYR